MFTIVFAQPHPVFPFRAYATALCGIRIPFLVCFSLKGAVKETLFPELETAKESATILQHIYVVAVDLLTSLLDVKQQLGQVHVTQTARILLLQDSLVIKIRGNRMDMTSLCPCGIPT